MVHPDVVVMETDTKQDLQDDRNGHSGHKEALEHSLTLHQFQCEQKQKWFLIRSNFYKHKCFILGLILCTFIFTFSLLTFVQTSRNEKKPERQNHSCNMSTAGSLYGTSRKLKH